MPLSTIFQLLMGPDIFILTMETNNNKTTFDEMERFCAVRRI
jgi:hypothetical protein